jgi:hypothetical protein
VKTIHLAKHIVSNTSSQIQIVNSKNLAEQQQTSLPTNNSNLASSLRTSILNVRDAQAQFLATMHYVNNLPAIVSSNSNINTVATSSLLIMNKHLFRYQKDN